MSDRPIDPEKVKGLADPDFKAPDMLGTVEGWRAWRVDLELPPFGVAPKLYSATYDYFWAPRVLARAECGINSEHVPGENCRCGFYSARDLNHLRTMGYHSYDADNGSVCVVGRMANWGKVIPGTQGWRAEKAYPVILYVPYEAAHLALPLRKAYGVPVKLANLLDKGKHLDPEFKIDTSFIDPD